MVFKYTFSYPAYILNIMYSGDEIVFRCSKVPCPYPFSSNCDEYKFPKRLREILYIYDGNTLQSLEYAVMQLIIMY